MSASSCIFYVYSLSVHEEVLGQDLDRDIEIIAWKMTSICQPITVKFSSQPMAAAHAKRKGAKEDLHH